ncbi:MAG: phospholipase D family protein [Nitrososphaerales archaeon]
MKVSLTFDEDHGRTLHGRLDKELPSATTIRIAVGFLTRAGVDLLSVYISRNPRGVKSIVVGHGGLEALLGLERLKTSYGISDDSLRIHLGAFGYVNGHQIFKPMMHSKIYYLEKKDGSALAFIGSHNLTEYAMLGKNCESGVVVSGLKSEKTIVRIQKHLSQIESESKPFDPNLINAYAWLNNKFVEGLYDRNDEQIRYNPVVIMASAPPSGPLPSLGDIIYFQVPIAYHDFNRFLQLEQKVHLYMYTGRAGTVRELSQSTNQVVLGHISGSQETGREGKEGTEATPRRVNWIIRDLNRPLLEPIPSSGLPSVNRALQVNVLVESMGHYRFDYSRPLKEKFFAIPSDRLVSEPFKPNRLASSDLPDSLLKEIQYSFGNLRFIQHVRKEQLALKDDEDLRGIKRMSLKGNEEQPPVWYSPYCRMIE